MGSTEGNLYAAWNARDYLSGKFLYLDRNTIMRAFAKSKAGEKVADIPYGFAYAVYHMQQAMTLHKGYEIY